MNKHLESAKKFIKEVKSEISKVTWPTWVELKGSTLLVIVMSVFFAVYIGFIDLILSYVRRLF